MALLEMQNINKSFNQVPVLHDVHLEVDQGEIHALLGENGAGKSTLMNILGGIHQPDSGTIKVNGQSVQMTTPKVSQHHGISFIHQELNLVSDLKVYENMFLGQELRKPYGFLDVKEMCRQTEEILTKLGVHIDPQAEVRDLGTSYKQMIEISRALLHKSNIIIMDEPTTALSDSEVERLFELMRQLKQDGISIIYISHKLKEVKSICDRMTVLRDGYVVHTGPLEGQSLDQITTYMVGKSVSEDRLVSHAHTDEVVLSVDHLTLEGFYHDVSFRIKRGEIVGFTGLAGDGRTELFESLFGYRQNFQGDVQINGQSVHLNHPKKAVRAGLGYVPKDRKENAIIQDMDVVQNMSISSLGHFEKNGFINHKIEHKTFMNYKDQLNIKANNPKENIDKLSGGNQQKVMIARWLELNTDIIIFDNPTQGIDVGAKQEIYQHIIQLAEQGKAVIILSSEAPEMMKVCHHVYVMYQGEIVGSFDGSEATEDNILSYATGSKKEAVSVG
ncbi:sugar ABC transporter ATP-binding protein [Alkalibacillus almallahensis]|uniref:sugar ABC transporter ATP-binding protein n=1 Tax=Alkalibacillus almallahensis TaxID=1379154 RepID=UPI001424767E|nr:sugar ABC transporter ATP-binding protein [Alkalibacillus almallahensis]NIK11439.1 ribose transport system ATP-binding protein [Alkalibacillus almallahensis]